MTHDPPREGATAKSDLGMTENKRRGRARILLASALALLVALNAGIGAPASEFAPKDSWWWTLYPLMWPTLFGGVVLGLVALATSIVSVRGGAIVCVLASLSTATGILVAAGTSDRQALAGYAAFIAMALIPAVVAVTGFRRDAPRQAQSGSGSV